MNQTPQILITIIKTYHRESKCCIKTKQLNSLYFSSSMYYLVIQYATLVATLHLELIYPHEMKQFF